MAAVLLGGGVMLAVVAAGAGGYRYRALADARAADGRRPRSVAEARRLELALGALAPRGIYIVVDAAENRLQLKHGNEVLREAVCSGGMGAILDDPHGGRRWIFDTPRGRHVIRGKIEDPVWREPDWFFIEQGEPIPTDINERLDPAAMGDYALDIGDGYFIHGTLYTRLLGKNVTHGCIRLADEDLETVFNAVEIGTPVYIY